MPPDRFTAAAWDWLLAGYRALSATSSALIHLLRPAARRRRSYGAVCGDRRYWDALGERFGFGPASCGGRRSGCTRCPWARSRGGAARPRASGPLSHAARRADHDHAHRPRARRGVCSAIRSTCVILPYDTPGSMRRFIARVRPRIGHHHGDGAVAESVRGVPPRRRPDGAGERPAVVASSVARYRRFGALFRGVLAGSHGGGAESPRMPDASSPSVRIPRRTHAIGNMKFDVGAEPRRSPSAAPSCAARMAGARPVWIAGSTHAGEEEAVLAAHAALEPPFPSALLLLVPRHPERFRQRRGSVGRRGSRFERRSSGGAVRPDSAGAAGRHRGRTRRAVCRRRRGVRGRQPGAGRRPQSAGARRARRAGDHRVLLCEQRGYRAVAAARRGRRRGGGCEANLAGAVRDDSLRRSGASGGGWAASGRRVRRRQSRQRRAAARLIEPSAGEEPLPAGILSAGR